MNESAGIMGLRAQALHHCDLCGGDRFAPVAHLDRRGKPLDTVVCTRCGLVSQARIPSDDELRGFFEVEHHRAHHGELTPSARRVMRAWRKGELIKRRLTPFIRRSDRVIEIGAGIGCTVKILELAGYETSGVDPNESLCSYAVTRLHAKMRQGSLLDLPADTKYDVALLVQAIEHVRSPRQALEHVHRILRPGGRVYVECHNAAAPFTAVRRLSHFGHVYNFTPATLDMLARLSGFEAVTQFATPDDPELRLLLVKSEPRECTIDPDSYRQTIAALARRDPLAHYLRYDYLRTQLAALARYASELMFSRLYVRRCLALCNESAAARAAVSDDAQQRRLAA